MRLAPLLHSAGIPAVLADPEISSLSYDSRSAGAGSLFFALPGAKTNGAEFARQAAGKGAVAVVAESMVEDCGCPVVRVPDARAAMADILRASGPVAEMRRGDRNEREDDIRLPHEAPAGFLLAP